MGNNNSGHVCTPQHQPWTQSLPRDAYRHKKYGAMQATKVLPERIPGQRLKPTENGRNLQLQGTISPRKISEIDNQPTECPPQLTNHHSSSMTALNHAANQTSVPAFQQTSNSVHDIRFGSPPSKSFTSEPDLRGASPASHVSLPVQSTAHTIICESPTKGKIKLKKRHKAPLPPPVQPSISLPLERPQSVPSSIPTEDWSSASSPPLKNFKSKSRKIGLFKKRSESRVARYEIEQPSLTQNQHLTDVAGREDRLRHIPQQRATTPVPLKISSKKELKERARSLDNLQHEIRHSPKEITTSLHNLQVIGSIPPEREGLWKDQEQTQCNTGTAINRRCSTIERDSHSRSKERHEGRTCTTLDRDSRSNKRMSKVERRFYEKQLEERRMEERSSSSMKENKLQEDRLKSLTPEYRRSSSSCSSYREYSSHEPKDEWDKAEEELLMRKKKSDNLQKEILNAARNLRKISSSPDDTAEIVPHNSDDSSKHFGAVSDSKDEMPKTFFFGMEPQELDINKSSNTRTALAKVNEQEAVTIIGSTVEYSRHSLRPKQHKRIGERDSWNRSLDYRDRNRSRSRERQLDDNEVITEDKRKLERKIDEFAATIERVKSKRVHSPEELSNSISRKGDGGYHSRQNSGSFHLDTEGSDEDNMIRMNLRPTLPKRQLELPRFSPNAAWRSLNVEVPLRQKDMPIENHLHEDVFNINEDKIHRYTRPTAPPRGSGEKSADSGISGDAGSPGPIQEFEPLTPEKLKSVSGPLAVSSPIASARLDSKNAWTPEQDLDDNSFEENGEQNRKLPMRQEVPALPKLTSRTNMFTKTFRNDEMHDEDEADYGRKFTNSELDTTSKGKYIASDIIKREFRHKIQVNQSHSEQPSSLQRVKRSLSSPRYIDDSQKQNHDVSNLHEDSWRENWSMSRSIPNSLNTCDEQDCVSNSSRQGRSRSESRLSGNQGDTKTQLPGSRPITPSYLQRGANGHIMYLPEYKSYQVSKKELPESKSCGDQNTQIQHKTKLTYYGDCPSTPDQERKSPSGDENPSDPETGRWNCPKTVSQNQDNAPFKWEVVNGKKHKKFTYQSTVRMLEKRKLEEKLSKEIEEKEKRRLKEVEAMMKVEQEFQKKREREKKRLKRQLILYQQQQQQVENQVSDHNDHNLSFSSEDKGFSSHSYDHSPPVERFTVSSKYSDQSQQPPHPKPFSSPMLNGQHQNVCSYQSLPTMAVNDKTTPYDNSSHHPSHHGLFSGLKKWVKGKKEHCSGYLSDASSATVTSVSRQDPDGAPAASSPRKNGDFRSEIIAASRHRNGIVLADSPSDFQSSRSPAASIASKESHRRPFTPDTKRPMSPDSRKSLLSEPCPLTQELPEMRQEQRQYREYRRSSKKLLMPNIMRTNHRVSPVAQNYRRDFCMGSTHVKVYHHHDDSDRYSRHSNDSRKSKQSLGSSKLCSSTDLPEPRDIPLSRTYRQYSSPKPPIPVPLQDSRGVPQPDALRNCCRLAKGYQSPPVNGSSARFAQSLITPFAPNKGYRPVSFSPPPNEKILTVT